MKQLSLFFVSFLICLIALQAESLQEPLIAYNSLTHELLLEIDPALCSNRIIFLPYQEVRHSTQATSFSTSSVLKWSAAITLLLGARYYATREYPLLENRIIKRGEATTPSANEAPKVEPSYSLRNEKSVDRVAATRAIEKEEEQYINRLIILQSNLTELKEILEKYQTIKKAYREMLIVFVYPVEKAKRTITIENLIDNLYPYPKEQQEASLLLESLNEEAIELESQISLDSKRIKQTEQWKDTLIITKLCIESANLEEARSRLEELLETLRLMMSDLNMTEKESIERKQAYQKSLEDALAKIQTWDNTAFISMQESETARLIQPPLNTIFAELRTNEAAEQKIKSFYEAVENLKKNLNNAELCRRIQEAEQAKKEAERLNPLAQLGKIFTISKT